MAQGPQEGRQWRRAWRWIWRQPVEIAGFLHLQIEGGMRAAQGRGRQTRGWRARAAEAAADARFELPKSAGRAFQQLRLALARRSQRVWR